MRNNNISKLIVSALLCAVGIAIPMFSPVKVVLPPASFTLGSHVAIFIAMFISPAVAVVVALGTACGFLYGGFPVVIVLRALTHVVFAFIGAAVLQKRPAMLSSLTQTTAFSLCMGLIHALCEIIVVTAFYFGNNMSEAYYDKGFLVSVLLLVGAGTVIHSMIDFSIALVVWAPVKKTAAAAALF